MSMYLHTLTLNNVRQFGKRTFEFRPGFNLLVGENGAGKTTILRGLLAAFGSARQMGRRPKLEDSDIRLNKRNAEVDAIIKYSEDEFESFQFKKTLWEPETRSIHRRKLPLILVYSSNEATCAAMKVKSSKRRMDIYTDSMRLGEEFLYTSERDSTQNSGVANVRRFGNSQSVRSFANRMLSTFTPDMGDFFWKFEPYDCTLIPNKTITEDIPRVAEMQKEVRAFVMRWLDEMGGKQKKVFQWPDQPKILLSLIDANRKDRVKRLPNLRDIWDDMDVSQSTMKILRSCSLEIKLTPRIMLNRAIGTLNLRQLSDGEQRLFSLFVDISRQLSIHNPNEKFGEGQAVILIDEIDVHLHPKWQRRIVPALEDLFPNVQFIATTHSPFVIQATRREQITTITQNSSTACLSGGNSIEDIVEEIQGVLLPQRSMRAEQLADAAKTYFSLLELQAVQAGGVDPVKLLDAERSYRAASEPFTSDPAVHALLNLLAMGNKP